MVNVKSQKIEIKNANIIFFTQNDEDYISLTDIARYKNPHEPKDVIKNWFRNKSVIEFLGLWEKINNNSFKGVEFDSFKFESGSNSFTLSPNRWINGVNAIGIISKSGKNGGTFAHKDIAFEFASWISAEFKLYLIKEFQHLKDKESSHEKLEWNAKRFLVRANYKVHTDAVQQNLIPSQITRQQATAIYASEADVLNIALFSMTAKQWREINQNKRLERLNQIAIIQMKSLISYSPSTSSLS